MRMTRFFTAETFLRLSNRLAFRGGRKLLKQPSPVNHDALKAIIHKSAAIEGFLFGREPEALFRLAFKALSTVENNGAAIEIGSFCGKSTVALASAARLKKGIVVCIDPLTGSPEHAVLLQGQSTERAFRHNLHDFIQDGTVRLLRLTSDEAVFQARDILKTRTVAFVFIDGLHTYLQVKHDFENYFPFLREKGLIAIHDTMGSWLGPTRFALELADHPSISGLSVVGTITYGKKQQRTWVDTYRSIVYRSIISSYLALKGQFRAMHTCE